MEKLEHRLEGVAIMGAFITWTMFMLILGKMFVAWDCADHGNFNYFSDQYTCTLVENDK